MELIIELANSHLHHSAIFMGYHIKWDDEGVLASFGEVVTAKDIFAFNDDIYGDIRFDIMRYQIIDMLSIERFEVSESDMRRIAATDAAAARWSAYQRRVRIAVITTHADAIRLTELYSDSLSAYSNWEAGIFSEVAKAHSWAREP